MLGARLLDGEAAAVVGNHAQRAIQRKVEDVAFILHDFAVVALANGPRALDAEGALEVRFRSSNACEHEDAGPWLDGDAGCELSAGEGNRLRVQRVFHGLLDLVKGSGSDACLGTCADIHGVVMVEGVLGFCQQVCHRMTTIDSRQVPEGMVQDVEQGNMAERYRWLLGPLFQVVQCGCRVRATNEV